MGPVDASAVMTLRADVLARSEALGRAAAAPAAPAPADFGTAMRDALTAVDRIQDQAAAATDAYERGDTHDLASVMIARQKASIAFEATLQVRNRLLGAYKDVMNMPL